MKLRNVTEVSISGLGRRLLVFGSLLGLALNGKVDRILAG
jgi:hypothetical protein